MKAQLEALASTLRRPFFKMITVLYLESHYPWSLDVCSGTSPHSGVHLAALFLPFFPCHVTYRRSASVAVPQPASGAGILSGLLLNLHNRWTVLQNERTRRSDGGPQCRFKKIILYSVVFIETMQCLSSLHTLLFDQC